MFIKLCLRRLDDNTGDSDNPYLLPLATLGGMTEIELILIDKVSKESDTAMQYRGHFHIEISPM